MSRVAQKTTAAGDENRAPGDTPVIIIPAYNEGEVIRGVLEEIFAHCQYPVFVVDDASTDNTLEEARAAGAQTLSLPVQLGAWGATQTGLRYALKNGFQVALTMDADGQHEATSIRQLAAPIIEGRADVAIGACTQRGSALRKVAWRMMKRVSGVSLEDITSGFRVYNRKAIRELSSRRATLLDYQDIGVLLLLQNRGLKIVDVAVDMQPRRNGGSRIFSSWLMVAYYMSHTLLLGLSKRRRLTLNSESA